MNTLNQQYEEKVRPCIDLIDSLRSLGVEKDLALPAIAVIGDQSSGKSSVLEALSGVALPRGSGIVTRCPLELKMKRRKEGEGWYGKISYQDFEEELKDLAGVENKIREGTVYTVLPSILEIASPDVPDLTLIDLPGITRVAVSGQKGNIENQKFITKQETISLVVVPCNVDIATTEALKMAQEVDPEGERTLGIMTKPDLVDKGTEDSVLQIVHNEVFPLKKGYMIVKCRGQKEIKDKVSLTEALEREEAFFSEHAYFKTLYDEGHATVPKLAEKLTLELVHHIKRSLPRLEEQIEKKLKTTQANLDKCGHGPPPDATERIGYLIDVSLPADSFQTHILDIRVTAFTKDATSLATGEELNLEAGQTSFPFSGKIHWNIEKEVNQYERKYRGRELPGFISYKTFEGMVKEQIKQLEGPALLKLKGVTGMSYQIVKKELLELAQSSLVGLPNLIRTAQMKIEAITKEKEAAAESMLRTQFKMEMIVYTQDSTYGKKLGKRKREEAQPAVIAGQRLADQIPLVIRYHVMQESALQLHREMLQMLQDKEKTECLLQEDFSMETKRRQLQKASSACQGPVFC
ncbi:hypothetical protein F7725_016676 [Dissostichus mawsoni]|uniref:Interferon-induced GTP-binding protein Mx n=1 Tax=Dissostichus mawsoni TaxID=36200 RepID=A0A7J5Z356_DISMA|nr:hypothetical protein F7725_016676 [Dissostichus mawsoni]